MTNLLTRHLSSLRSVPWHYWNSFSSFIIVRNLHKSFRGETVSGVAKWRLFSQVTFSSLFIAFPLTENNVVLSWFTKVIPSSLWRNDGPMGKWHGNCTLIVKLRIAPALSCRQRQERRSMSDMRTSSNHSKNDSSTDDSNHKIIVVVVCGLANLRCSAGCRLDSACGKHERNGF